MLKRSEHQGACTSSSVQNANIGSANDRSRRERRARAAMVSNLAAQVNLLTKKIYKKHGEQDDAFVDLFAADAESQDAIDDLKTKLSTLIKTVEFLRAQVECLSRVVTLQPNFTASGL